MSGYQDVIGVDVERILSQFLRSSSAVTNLVGQRVYSALPKECEWPAVRLTRVGGGPVTVPPRLDLARIQIDVWGGTKAQARIICATVLAVAVTDLPGVYDNGAAVVSAVRSNVSRYQPDTTFTPSRPRYLAELGIYSHPNS